MRKLAYVLAAAAALSITVPAAAQVTDYNFDVTGDATGSFQLAVDSGSNTASLLGINLDVAGASFTDANTGLGATNPPAVLGGTQGGFATLDASGADDFWLVFNFNLDSQSPVLFYHLASDGIGTEQRGSVTFTRSLLSVSAAPEPATWAMMLLGFAGIGVALRRDRKVAEMLAA